MLRPSLVRTCVIRPIGVALTLIIGAMANIAPVPAAAADLRSLPMHFELRQEGPAQACDKHCRTWISASGAITADTPRDFLTLIEGHNVRGATVALDSDGGSVLGAIALGREIRRLDMTTMVSRSVGLGAPGSNDPHAELQPKADCESMCTFVLLAGVKRYVPAEARVMVHQIWLGDRRDDPTAASYSAEDLVLVQRDIGRLAIYTAEMGGSMELLDIALRIPPWEPMRALTRDELRRVRLDTTDDPFERSAPAVVATNSAPAQSENVSLLRPARINEHGWAMIDRGGATALARRHPLTIEGDNIGSFDLTVACAIGTPDSYLLTYTETRRGADVDHAPPALRDVNVYVGQKWTQLTVVSSERGSGSAELESVADLLKTFAASGNHSLTIATTSPGSETSIRIGNTGINRNFSQLSTACDKTRAADAQVARPKTGNLAQALPPARAQ